MRKLLFFTFFVVSILLFLNAPSTFSRSFCQIELLLYLTMSILFLWRKVKDCGLINFDFFFLLSFLLINYIHPVFIYPNDKMIPSFAFPYNERIISYALSVAHLGISTYMLGNVCGESRAKKKNNPIIYNLANNITQRLALIFAMGVFFYVFFVLKQRSGIVHLYPRLMILVISVICLAFYNTALSQRSINNFKFLIKENRLNIISFFIFSLSILFLGSRDVVIFLGLFILSLANTFYFRIKVKWILPLLLIGGGLMIMLTITRVSEVNLMSSSFVDVLKYAIDTVSESPDALSLMFVDFLVAARNLYDGIDYANGDNLLYGATYIQYLFVFIPFGGGFFTKFITGKSLEEVHTASVLTIESNADFGLGTNAISDIYMNFSIYGIFIMMFIFGLFVARVERCNGKYSTFAYLALVANSLYIPRANIFCWLDMFAFIVIFDYLVNHYVKTPPTTQHDKVVIKNDYNLSM